MNKRVFLAFPLDPEVSRYLHSVVDTLARDLAEGETVRWIRPDGMHITAHFLGDQPVEKLSAIKTLAQNAASRFAPVGVRLGEVSSFPPSGPPRVVVATVVEDERLTLRQIQRQLAVGLQKEGIEVDRRLWSPHVTLGRVKIRLAPERFSCPLEPKNFTVDRLELIESRLNDEGAQYNPLAVFPLSAGL